MSSLWSLVKNAFCHKDVGTSRRVLSGHWSRMHFVTRMWGHVDEFYLVIGQGCILSQGCRDK